MKLGRFIVDAHVHAQRFAAGSALAASGSQVKPTGYGDLAKAIRTLTPYDNSPRLLYDMACYDVDMCVLLPAFGMTNELNLQIVEAHPERFVAVCGAMDTQRKATHDEASWSAQAAAAELDALLATDDRPDRTDGPASADHGCRAQAQDGGARAYRHGHGLSDDAPLLA
jgi:hypothetical protein